MGQYHRFVFLDNTGEPVLSLSTRSTQVGAKLMEHSYLNSPYMVLVEHLLMDEFNGYSLIWCGDYSDGDIYDKACKLEAKSFVKLKPILDSLMKHELHHEGRFIINLSKKLYIDLDSIENEIHPLPLLCSISNGRGGGDYEGLDMELIGNWKGDKIAVSNEKPIDYEEFSVHFEER